jgi:uncharacterized protein YjdB
VVVTGTVVNGLGLGYNYTEDFTITTGQPTYNISDINAINAIIAAGNGLGWNPTATVDGSAFDASWTGVTWSTATDNKRIEGLNLSGESLSGNLDVTGLTAMTTLDVSGNELTGLNVTGLANLATLDCSINKILDLDLSSCTGLMAFTGGSQTTAPITLTGISPTKHEAAISLTRQLDGLTTGITHELSGSKLISMDYNIASTPFSIATGLTGKELSGTLNLTYDRFYAVTGITSVPATAGRGVALTLVGAVEPDNATFQNIVWTVDNAGTTGATIGGSSNDVLNTTANGTVAVRATIANGLSNDPADSPNRDFTQTFNITVSEAIAAAKVVIDQADPSGATPDVLIAFGGTYQLTATVLDALDNLATDQTVRWSSSVPGVAKIHPVSGKVTAGGTTGGTTTITVTSVDGNFSASITLEVGAPVAVTGVTLNHTAETIGQGGTLPLTATVAPGNASNKNVTWASDASGIASVDQNGLVTAVSTGTANITVTTVDGNFSASCAITVDPPVAATGVTVSPTAATIGVGATQQLTATVTAATGNATNQNVTWTDGGSGFATVDANGLVTAVAVGTETITVTSADGGFTATAAITVIAAVPVTGVSISPSTATITAIGATQQLTPVFAPLNATNTNVTWSSSANHVATVSTSGLVTAVALGTATITVTTADGGFTATCAITVSSAPTTYAVTVSSVGTGASGSGNYAAGATVNINAGAAPSGYTFSHWTASPSVAFANSGSPTTSFTMIASAVTVTAHFVILDTDPPTDPDLIDVYNAIDLVQYTTVSIPQSSGNTRESASQWLESYLNDMFAQRNYNVTVSVTGFSTFEPAVAGSATNPKGTNGSVVFSATFSKGAVAVPLSYIHGRIVATTFTANEAAAGRQPLKAVADNGAVIISGLHAGDDLKIYNISGRLVYNTKAGATEARVDLAPGIYIITSGNRTVKFR